MPLDASIFGGGSGLDQIKSDLVSHYQSADAGEPFSSDPVVLSQRLARKLRFGTSDDFDIDYTPEKPKTAKPDKAEDLSSFGDPLPDQPSTDDLSSFGSKVEPPQPPQPTLGVGGNVKAFGKGVPTGAAEGVGGALKGAAHILNDLPYAPTSPEEAAAYGAMGGNPADAQPKGPVQERPLYRAGKVVEGLHPNMTPEERDSFGGTLGTMVGGVAPYALITAANPAVGIAAGFTGMSASTYGHVYEDALAKGADEATARSAATKAAGAAGILGALPLGSGKLAQSLIGKIATSGVTFASANEASEYVLQQIAKDYDPKAGYSPEAKRIIASLITGGLLGGLHHAFERAPGQQQDQQPVPTPREQPAGEIPNRQFEQQGFEGKTWKDWGFDDDAGAQSSGPGPQGGPRPGSGGATGENQSGTGGGPKPNQGGPGGANKPPPGSGEGMGPDYTMDAWLRAKMERILRTFEPGRDPSKMSDAELYNTVNEHLRDTSSTGHTAKGDTPEEQAQREAHAKKREEDQILRDAGWDQAFVNAMTPEQRAQYVARAQGKASAAPAEEPVDAPPGSREAPIKANTAADTDISPARAGPERILPESPSEKGGEPEAVHSVVGSPQVPHAPSDGGRSPVHAGDEPPEKINERNVVPGKEYVEPTEEHHVQIEAALGSDFDHVLPADAARAAEILAGNPDLPPHIAFQYAVIQNAADQNLLSHEQLEQIYGRNVRQALEPESKQSSSGSASENARARSTRITNASKDLEPGNLLQFIASKGGLKPHPELKAIDAQKHLVEMQGFPARRRLVKGTGLDLDTAREAAEEAGYLRGEHDRTSTIRDLLDAIDDGMRGNHRFPEGHEGTRSKRERRLESEREQHEQDRYQADYADAHRALDAEYPGLPLDLRDTAAHAMAVDGYDLNTAVEYAAIWQVNRDDKLYEQTDRSIVDTFGPGANDAIHTATASGNGEQALRHSQEEGRPEGSRKGDRDGGPVPEARAKGGREAAQGLIHGGKPPGPGLKEPEAPIEPLGARAQTEVLEFGRATGNEHLRVIDARGKLAFSAEGTTNGIAVTKAMEEAFFDPASDLVIHHNHPRNRSFSDDDISLLTSPGIRTIWAHGHGGGIYRVELMPVWRNMIGTRRDDVTGAYRGLRTLWRRVEELLLQTAHPEALRPGNEALKEAFEIAWAHLINTVLHRGGVIDYKTNFEPDPSVLKMEGLSDAMEQAIGLLNREFPDAETATVRNNRPAGTVRHPGNMGASFYPAEVARTVGPARRRHQESRENDRPPEKEGLSEPSRVFGFLSQPTSNFDNSFNDLLGKRLLGRLGDLNATEARVQLQDKFLRVQKAEQLKRNTDTQLSAYQAESLYYGRTGHRLEQLREHQIDPLIREMKARDIDLNKLEDILYARHAVERNQKLGQHYEPGHDFYEAMTDPDKVGASGMSQNEALGIIRAIRAENKLPDYLALARMVDALNARTRRALLDGGLIDRDTFDAMNTTYKYYVPLRGWQEGSDDEQFHFGTGGMETRGKDVKQAFGRKSRAASPLAYSIMQAESAVVRAEKNKVGNTFLKFVRTNPDPDLWVVNRPQMRKEISKVSGLVYSRPDNLSYQDDSVFVTKVQGKPVYIRMLGADGLNLARALKNMGSANAHSAVRMLAAVTHTMSRLATAWNPEFMIPNLVRDISEAFINLGEQQQRQFAKNFAKRVFPAIRGSTLALAGKTPPAGSPMTEYVDAFHRFDREGGRIHFFGLDDPDQIERNVDAKLRRLSGGTINNLKDLGEKAGKALEVAGGGLENATRLAAFMAAEDAGMSSADAAMLARNLTVNFNKKGELGTIISSLYAFGNAGIQGIARMLRALHPRNTKVWAAVGALAAANLAATAWDLGAGGKDEAGTYNYMKIPHWERDKNVVIMLTNGYYAKVPLPYGFAPFGVVGTKTATVMAGAEKPTKAATAVLSSTINAFNPLGDEAEMWREIVPTVFRPLVHIESNKDWTGRAIYPDSGRSKGLPDSTQAFRSTSGASKWVAQKLNALTGGSKYESGVVDIHPGTFDYIVGAVVGGVGHFVKAGWNTIVAGVMDHEWRPETIPVLRRFVGRVGPEADQYAYYQARDEARSEANAVAQARKERRNGDQDAIRFTDEHRGQSKKAIFNQADREMRTLRAEEDRVKASGQPYETRRVAIDQIRQRMREVQNRARASSAKLQWAASH